MLPWSLGSCAEPGLGDKERPLYPFSWSNLSSCGQSLEEVTGLAWRGGWRSSSPGYRHHPS